MTNEKYLFFKFLLKNKLYTKLNVLKNILTLIVSEYFEDEFIKVDNKKFFYKDGEDIILITNDYKEPLFSLKDTLTLTKEDIANIDGSIDTTVGRALVNVILLAEPFKDKIKYINDIITVGDIEKTYIVRMLSNDADDKQGITINEYMKFMDSVMFLEGLSKYLSISATEKSILPPKGLKQVKQRIMKDKEKKYGKEWYKNKLAIIEMEDELKTLDEEWLKDDPSYNKLITGKVKNNARKRLFLMFGIGNSFDDEGYPIIDSLADGWNIDNLDALTAMNNDLRAGSYGRGVETQDGGVVAKVTLRATTDVKFIHKDCGSKSTLDVLVTDDIKNNLIGRYMIKGDKPVMITDEDLKSLVGKVINVRSGLYCKEAPNFCTTCTNELFKDYKDAASLLSSGIGGDILNMALSKFHYSGLKTIILDTEDLLS